MPSDFGIMADAVSIGSEVRARHDTLCFVSLALCSSRNGRLYTPLHSSPAVPFGGHSGEAFKDVIVAALAQHPARWRVADLRSRCAVISGDGALCEGGPEHRHTSTAAAEKLWHEIYPDASSDANAPLGVPPCCTVWDPFHRIDNAAWRAIKACPAAINLFDVATKLDPLMNQGDGGLLWRGVGEVLGEKRVGSIRAPGGTRKIGYLSKTPGAVLEHFKMLVATLHARVAWSQEGHRHHPIYSLQDMARQITDVSFVTLGCVFKDILQASQLKGFRCCAGVPTVGLLATAGEVTWIRMPRKGQCRIQTPLQPSVRVFLLDFTGRSVADMLKLCKEGLRPFVMISQQMLSPASFAACQRATVHHLSTAKTLIQKARALFRVVELLRQHADTADLTNLVAAYRTSRLGKYFPSLFAAAVGLLQVRPQYQGASVTSGVAQRPVAVH
jgi:hypothetical protein